MYICLSAVYFYLSWSGMAQSVWMKLACRAIIAVVVCCRKLAARLLHCLAIAKRPPK